jgi:hypothetical protein
MRKIIAFLLNLSLIALPSLFARAQTAAYAEVAAIDAQKFPHISALLDVYDANGEFVTGLKTSDLAAYEDSQPRTVDSLTESTTPAQIVVAINPGSALGVRDTTGTPRYDHVVAALNQWASAQDTNDDISLVALSGSLIGHAAYKDFSVSLNSFVTSLPICKRLPLRSIRSVLLRRGLA